MSAMARLGDYCTGHGCWPPRTGITASSNVHVNGRRVHRVGDAWNVHCCKDSCHPGAVASGAGNVYINGRPAARIGDPISCGSVIAGGSSNVWAGDYSSRAGSILGIDSMLNRFIDFDLGAITTTVPRPNPPVLGGLVLSGAGF